MGKEIVYGYTARKLRQVKYLEGENHTHHINLSSTEDNKKIGKNIIARESYGKILFPNPSNILKNLLDGEQSSEVNTFHFDFNQMENKVLECLGSATKKTTKEQSEKRKQQKNRKKNKMTFAASMAAGDLEENNENGEPE